MLQRLVSNPVCGPDVWAAMAADWDATIAKVPPILQNTLVSGVATFVEDRALAERVVAFHRSHKLAVGQQRVEQALERMRNGVAFAARARPQLDAALAAP